jgi:hypothetical protein
LETTKPVFLFYLSDIQKHAWRIKAMMGIGCWGKDASDSAAVTFWNGLVAIKAQVTALEVQHPEMPKELLIFEIEDTKTKEFISLQRRLMRFGSKRTYSPAQMYRVDELEKHGIHGGINARKENTFFKHLYGIQMKFKESAARDPNADINIVFEKMRSDEESSPGKLHVLRDFFGNLKNQMENGVATKDGIPLHWFQAWTESGHSFRSRAERLRLKIKEECVWTSDDEKNYLNLQARTRKFVKDNGIELNQIPNLPFEIAKFHLMEEGYYCPYLDVFEMIWNSRTGCVGCQAKDCRILQHNHIDPFTKVIAMSAVTDVKTFHEEAPKVEVLCMICHRDKSYGPDGDISKKLRNSSLTSTNEKPLGLLTKKAVWDKFRIDHGCCLCGAKVDNVRFKPHHFDGHHVNEKTKTICLSQLVGSASADIFVDVWKTEKRLVVVLCCQCHHIITFYHRKAMYEMLREARILEEAKYNWE